MSAKLIVGAIEEIKKHRWIESQKNGGDIGGNMAALDWLEKHYENWLGTNLAKSDPNNN